MRTSSAGVPRSIVEAETLWVLENTMWVSKIVPSAATL